MIGDKASTPILESFKEELQKEFNNIEVNNVMIKINNKHMITFRYRKKLFPEDIKNYTDGIFYVSSLPLYKDTIIKIIKEK